MVLSVCVVPLCDPVLGAGEVVLAGIKPLVTELAADWQVGQSAVKLQEGPVGHVRRAAEREEHSSISQCKQTLRHKTNR